MKFTPTNLLQLTLVCFFVFLNYSCNKDSDLLAEYVVEENSIGTEPNEVILDLANAVFTTEEDQPVTFNLLDNTSLKREGRTRYKSSLKPKYGEITIEKDSIAIYTPSNDYNGKDDIEITLEVTNEDDTIEEVVVNVDVTVEPVEDVVEDKVEVTSEEAVTIAPLENDTFKEESVVVITEVSQPANGTAVLNEDNTITYTPNTTNSEDTITEEIATEVVVTEENVMEEVATEEVVSSEEDTFTYTTAVTNSDNSVTTETGSISVTTPAEEETITDPNSVNFSKYGAVGDGKADDTKALQAALDAEGSLVASSGAVFKISSTLNIDQGFVHTINWNGATIITSSKLSPMIQVDKRQSNGGLTTMTDLNIDGNKVAQRGIECNTRVNLTNFEVDRFRQSSTASPAGVYIHVYNDAECYGDWVFDNVNVSDVRGADNGVTTDSWGAANGYLIYWVDVPSSPTKLIVKNGEVHDCWGEDSQTIGTFSSGIDISYSNGSMEFINMNFYDWERRCVKNFTGNTTFTNCTFTDPSPTNPNLSSKNKSGMVVVGMGSGAKGGDNTVFNNCTFTGTGYDGRVIALQNDYVEFNNCTFTGGSRLAFTMWIGDVTICNNVFGAGSSIYGYNISDSDYKGTISVGTSNTGLSGNISLDSTKWESTSDCN